MTWHDDKMVSLHRGTMTFVYPSMESTSVLCFEMSGCLSDNGVHVNLITTENNDSICFIFLNQVLCNGLVSTGKTSISSGQINAVHSALWLDFYSCLYILSDKSSNIKPL